MSKKSCLRVRFNKQHGKRAQTLFKSRRGQFYHIYWLLWRQMSLKNSLIVICKILRLFVNTFIAFDKSCVFSRECLRHPIHMELSQKQKNVSKFFFGFLKSRLHFEHIPKKKVTLISNVFSKLQTFKTVVRWISKKYRFRVPLEKQHGKQAQTLLKSERRLVYHFYWPLWGKLSLKKSLLVICKIFRFLLSHSLLMTSILFLIENI